MTTARTCRLRYITLPSIALLITSGCSRSPQGQFVAAANTDTAVFVEIVPDAKEPAHRTAVVHYIYRTPQRTPTGSWTRLTASEEFDCRKGASRVLRTSYYSPAEQLLAAADEKDSWETQDPARIGGAVLATVCGRANEMKIKDPIAPEQLRSWALAAWPSP